MCSMEEVTGLRYRDKILDPYVRPYAAAIGNDFILMDDNARPHRAGIVEEYLEDHEVAALNPPPRSLHELKQGLRCLVFASYSGVRQLNKQHGKSMPPMHSTEKLNSYENVKPSSQKLTKFPKPQEWFSRNTGNPEFRKFHSFKVEKNVSGNHNSTFANPSYITAWDTNTGFHPPISCYGCGIKRVPLSTPYRCLLVLPPQ
ncbi:uncharacterized protein TNCV_1744961 [Trichonephila clavipes]|nr:uncharacterized protein TNCV_1744961 [Trichonephila clavipes]